MWPRERITSPQNPRLRPYRLLAAGHRRRREPLLLLEGVRLVETALDAGVHLTEVLQSPRLERTDGGRALSRRLASEAPMVRHATDRVLGSISELSTHQGVLALAPRPDGPSPAELTRLPGMLLVAVGLQDPGNMGGLVRVADAARAAGLIAVSGADPWSPRALRASAGSSFRLPLTRLGEIKQLPSLLDGLESSGRQLLAATSRHGDSCFEASLPGTAALLVGSEATGLDAAALARSRPVRVPMREGVESLNVVAAAAVLLFEAQRQRDLREQR